MNTLNKKLNNLKEIIKDLETTKRYNDNINHTFLLDGTIGGGYEAGLRKLDKNSISIYLLGFIISIYKYKSYELELILKNKKCYIISKKNNGRGWNERAVVITDEEFEKEEIEKKIINIFINGKGTKKDFRSLNDDYLFIFYKLNPSFFSEANIEKITMAEQLKNF